jgi:hypothetical protein
VPEQREEIVVDLFTITLQRTSLRGGVGVLVMASMLLAGIGDAQAFPLMPELVYDANAVDNRSPLKVNRNGDLFTVFRSPGSQADRLLFVDAAAQTTRYDSEGTWFVNWSISNWGVAITNFGANSGVWGGPIGAMPEEILRATPNGSFSSPPMINDAGAIGFLGRMTNSHGLREVYRQLPGQPLETLPDLGEDALNEQAVMDEMGRIIALHRFTSPTPAAYYRYEPSAGWVELMLRPEGESFITGNAFHAGSRPVGIDGDFIFVTTQRVNGVDHQWFNRYDDATQSVTPLFDGAAANGQSMTGIVQVSDRGDVLIAAQNSNLTQLRYFQASGNVVDLMTLLPVGQRLAQLPQMNHAGDVILTGANPNLSEFTFYIWDGNRVRPITTINERPWQYGLSDDRQFYTWLRDGDTYDLVRYDAVPEPAAIWLAASCLVVVGVRRWRTS